MQLRHNRAATEPPTLCLLGVALACAPLLSCGPPPPPPDIVLYVVDTLRADALAPYGDPIVETPAVARLAEEGVLFEHTYASSSWTRASIATILTGLAPDAHGVERREHRAPDALHLISERLKEAGYTTAAIVTNPNVGTSFGFDQGYDHFAELFVRSRPRAVVPSAGLRHRSDVVTERAIEWIRSAPRPFFLFILTTDPHSPYAPPKGFDRYSSADDPRERSPTLESTPQTEADRARYFGEVAFNDHSFGRLLDHLRQAGLYDDALIVFTSDHGEAFGEHGYRWHAKTLFEEVVHVPLILKRPREPEPGRRIAAPVSLVDLVPTLLHAAGVEIDDGARVLPRSADAADAEIFARIRLDAYEAEMLLAPPWKWIESIVRPADEERAHGGLYDLERDPFESADQRTSHPELAADLARRLEQRRRHPTAAPTTPAEAPADAALPDDVRTALELLGYLEAGASPAADPPADGRE